MPIRIRRGYQQPTRIARFFWYRQPVGGAGDDTFAFGPGSTAAAIDGSAGNNTLDYTNFANAVTVSLLNKSATNLDAGFERWIREL